VFEIGSSLRAAREQRGLELADVERATRIRSRYLRALEEERFDLIPGLVYAKGFLRTYADHLGLDGGRFVDELVSRLPREEDEAPLPAPRPIQRRGVRMPAHLAAIVASIVLVAAGVVWLLGTTGGSTHRTRRQTTTASRPSPVAARPRPRPPPAPVPRRAALVLSASNGRCWIEAHAGSQTGPLLYMNTLEQGRSLTLKRTRLWIRLGAPEAVVATLNGKPVPLPLSPSTPGNLVVTPNGVHPVA
jgi:cytoskeleton protein RodZ